MFPHHVSTIQNVTEYFEKQPDVLALLLAGSIAHGFENAESDVDVLIVLTEEAYEARMATGKWTFVDVSLATYPGGFIDAKYISLSFIRKVAEKGSEPARFAFADYRILFNRIEGLEAELEKVVVYPVAGKAERIGRFTGQLVAWRWYAGEARKKGNAYLMGVAISKLTLFGGRLILAHNELLYPFHKWFLAVLDSAPSKPEGLMEAIQKLQTDPSAENVEAFYTMVKDFQEWDPTMDWVRWGPRFMADVELTWVDDRTAVDDL